MAGFSSHSTDSILPASCLLDLNQMDSLFPLSPLLEAAGIFSLSVLFLFFETLIK